MNPQDYVWENHYQIDEARTSGATVHFASLMGIRHLKNAELEAKHQNTKVELYSEVIL